MKRNNRISWLYAALAGTVLFSCTPREVEIPVIVRSLPQEYEVCIEGTDPGTKTHLEGTAVKWDNQDQVAIARGTTEYARFIYDATTNKLEWSEDIPGTSAVDIAHYVAAYPFSKVNSFNSDGSVNMTLPGTQAYVPGSFDPSAALMMSVFDANETLIRFKNVCGLVSIKLYGAGVNADIIELVGIGSGVKLHGNISVAMEMGGEPVISFTGNNPDYISMPLDPPVALGSSESESTEFLFAVPPGTYTFGMIVENEDGRLFQKVSSTKVTVQRNHIVHLAPVRVVLEGEAPVTEPDAVNLGLPSGTLWASCNLGAANPEEDGNYYAFAETETKDTYSEIYWKYYNNGMLLKYNLWEDYGTIDHRIGLDPDDDVAHVLLGSDWRIPTMEELEELRTNCTITTETVNGVSVRKYTGPNNKYIYIPNAGYRTGSRYQYKGDRPILGSRCVTRWGEENYNGMVRGAMMPNGRIDLNYSFGVSIRPVKRALVPATSITVSAPSSIMLEQKTTATAILSPEIVSDTRVSWTSSNPAVAKVNAETGEITALSKGGTVIRAYSSDGKLSNSARLNVLEYAVPDAVDLQLPSGTKWASMNLGASDAYEIGAYFAWGELNPKDNYAWSTYGFGRNSQNLTKYNGSDGRLELEVTKDDAARYHLGGTWRIPTKAEWDELISNCNLEAIDGGTAPAIKLTSKNNGNYIILPNTGFMNGTSVSQQSAIVYGHSSTVSTGDYANFMCFRRARNAKPNVVELERCAGYPIRPVMNVYVPVTSISIIPATSVTLYAGTPAQLSVSVTPSNASYKTATWESSDTSIATVDQEGWVTPLSPGEVTITATSTDNSSIKATKTITVLMAQPEAVNLGLPSGLKWASFNLGASHKTGFGSYYAWGETTPKTTFGWSTYLWGTSDSSLTKYNTSDGLVTLLAADDAATKNLGNGWRMPTQAELKELIDECTWNWTSVYDGHSTAEGALITGPSGDQIFIPAAGLYTSGSSLYSGYLSLWTSSRYDSDPAGAWGFYAHYTGDNPYFTALYRYWGLSIRPVKK